MRWVARPGRRLTVTRSSSRGPVPFVEAFAGLREAVGQRLPGDQREPVARPSHRHEQLAPLGVPPLVAVAAVLEPERLHDPMALAVADEHDELELEALAA